MRRAGKPLRIHGISRRPITGRRAGNGRSRLTTEGMENRVSSLCPKGKPSSLGCQRNGWKGESHSRLPAGCPSRCQARCREGSLKVPYFRAFSSPDNESNGETGRKSIRTGNGKPGFVCGVF